MTEDKYDNDINFAKVLFLHINRILMSVDDSMRFISNIEILEDCLFTYKDDKYTADLGGKVERKDAVKALDPMFKPKGNMMAQVELEGARMKFRALMGLAERKGLLLEKEDEGIDPGDTSEGYDTTE
jgi:hypothetical protein